MALDNIQIREEDKRVKPSESSSANSIKFKKSSLETAKRKISELEEARMAAMASLEKVVNALVDDNATIDQIKNDEIVKNQAVSATLLGDKIDVLSRQDLGVQGPVELVETRPIRLINKMITAAKENSENIYSGLEKEDSTKITPISIDVEEIAKENEEPLKDSVEEAINKNESLEEYDIKEVFDEELGLKPENESIIFDKDEIERAVNEKIDNFYANEDYSMSDEEIEKSSEKINEEKNSGVGFKKQFEGIVLPEMPSAIKSSDEAIRDEIVVTPERKEVEEYTFEKEEMKPKELSPMFSERQDNNVIAVMEKKDNVEARGMEISAIDKDVYKGKSIDELKELVAAMDAEKSQLQEQLNVADETVEEARRKNAEIAAEEEESEKKHTEILAEEEEAKKILAELGTEADRKENEIKEMLIKRASVLDSEKKNLTTTIQSREEEIISIEKDTESRRAKISANNSDSESRTATIANISKESASIQERIDKYKEMQKMFNDSENDSEEVVQMVR